MVALPSESQQLAQRFAPRVARTEDFPLLVGIQLDLAVVIDIHADDIEGLGRTTELRGEPSGEHVERLIGLAVGLVPRFVRQIGAVGRRNSVNHRIDMHHPRIGLDLAYGFHAFDVHADQRALQLVFPAFRERIHPFKVARRGRKEGDLVDGCEEIGPFGTARDEFGDGSAIMREALEAFVRKGVAAVGETVMAKVPDRRDLALGGGVLRSLDA